MTDYPFFPAFVDLSGRRAGVAAGGGNHALARRATQAVRHCLENDLDSDD